jgi:hypothetical protein
MSNGSHSSMPLRSLSLLAVLASAGMAASTASAQFASAIDVSSRSAQPKAGQWQSQLAVSPFARFDSPRLAIDARWTAFGGSGQRVDGFGNLAATYFSPTRAGLQLSVAGFADRTMLNETYPISRLGTDARLSYRAGSSGAWLGRTFSRDNKSTPFSPVADYSAGGWRQWRHAVLTLSVSSFGSVEGARAPSTHQVTEVLAADTQVTRTVVDSGSAGRRHDWRDAELGLHWSVGRLAFRGIVGARFSVTNEPNETWGQVQGTVSLAPDIALIAASGVHPSSAAYGLPRARFLELGFRVAPTALMRPRLPAGVRPRAASFEVEDAERGQRTLRIRVPGARSVELSGDFTNWTPIVLRRGETDQWEATLPISPGMHRLAIRVDGDAWAPPPGITAVPDEFQGTVGVIVVK